MKLKIIANYALIISGSSATLVEHCAHFHAITATETILEFATFAEAEQYAMANGIVVAYPEEYADA